MRIAGNIFLVLGILMFIAFAIIVSTSDMSAGALVIPVLVILMGIQFRRAGSGILRDAPSSTSAPGTGSSAAVSAETPAGTVEIPMTPEVNAAIAREYSRAKKWHWILIVAPLVLFFALGLALGTSGDNPEEKRQYFVIFAGLGVFLAALFGLILWLWLVRPVAADLGATSFLRTTGPVELVYIRNGYVLRLADRAFILRGRECVKPLKALGWGTVDHSPRGHVVLAAWDRQGNSVFVAPGARGPSPLQPE
jgi:hypothetical protein